MSCLVLKKRPLLAIRPKQTPISSLDVSVVGDRADIDEFEYKHGEATIEEIIGDDVMIDTGHD